MSHLTWDRGAVTQTLSRVGMPPHLCLALLLKALTTWRPLPADLSCSDHRRHCPACPQAQPVLSSTAKQLTCSIRLSAAARRCDAVPLSQAQGHHRQRVWQQTGLDIMLAMTQANPCESALPSFSTVTDIEDSLHNDTKIICRLVRSSPGDQSRLSYLDASLAR